jgi:valyl-tRNA synthetase
VPFEKVYLHGLVRDARGKKMSKSKGNVISPLEISKEYGTDALRMGLVIGNTIEADMNLDVNKIKGYMKFGNKIWNAARFVLEKTGDLSSPGTLTSEDQALMDAWKAVKTDITGDIENYRLHLASEKLYDYFWKTFCDQSSLKRTKSALRIIRIKKALRRFFLPFFANSLLRFTHSCRLSPKNCGQT